MFKSYTRKDDYLGRKKWGNVSLTIFKNWFRLLYKKLIRSLWIKLKLNGLCSSYI